MRIFKLLMMVVISLCGSIEAFSREDTPFEVTVDGLANRSTRNGIQRPVYTLTVGDPFPSEVRGYEDILRFGPFALDGTIYARHPDHSALWFAANWRKPRVEEERRFFREFAQKLPAERSSFFTAMPPGRASDILPLPFDKLADEDLKIVSSLVKFQDGTMRVHFHEWIVGESEVFTFIKEIQRNYPLNIHTNIAPSNEE